MKYWTIIIGAVALFVSAQASATLINFENHGSSGDGDAVGSYYSGITFTGAYLEDTGGSGESGGVGSVAGFMNDETGLLDDPDPSLAPSPPALLQDWFVVNHDSFESNRSSESIYLAVNYTTAVSEASGQIWDIDGTSPSDSEQWKVTAFLVDGSSVSLKSPEYGTYGLSSLNGEPWDFSFDLGDKMFDYLEISFIGNKTSGIGLAFDNFNSSSAEIIDTPEPAAVWLFGLGVFCLGIGLAVRRKRLDDGAPFAS